MTLTVQGSIPNRDERDSASPKTHILALATSQHPPQWVWEVLSRDIQQPRNETHHSTAASTGIKNGWRYTSASPLRLNDMCRNNFYPFPYTGPKILLYTFLSKMFICFLSLFGSFQVSDAYANILSVIVFFSLNFCFFDMFIFFNKNL